MENYCGEPQNLANWPVEFGKIFCRKLWSLVMTFDVVLYGVQDKSQRVQLEQVKEQCVGIIGMLGGSINHAVVSRPDPTHLEKLAVAWDSHKHLRFDFPFQDIKPTIYFGKLSSNFFLLCIIKMCLFGIIKRRKSRYNCTVDQEMMNTAADASCLLTRWQHFGQAHATYLIHLSVIFIYYSVVFCT